MYSIIGDGEQRGGTADNESMMLGARTARRFVFSQIWIVTHYVGLYLSAYRTYIHTPQNLEMHRPNGYHESVLVSIDSHRLRHHRIVVVRSARQCD